MHAKSYRKDTSTIAHNIPSSLVNNHFILATPSKSQYLDYQYLKSRPNHDKWSSLWFPKEALQQKDFKLRNEEIRQIMPAGGIQDRLREFKSEGHKIYS